MPRFLPCLALTLLLAGPLAAQTTAPPTPAPDLYKRAAQSLREGHFFEGAIRDLAEAVRQDPTNAECHRALGDAGADRAGSLAYAAWMTDALLNARQSYPGELAAWRAAQGDPKSDDYGRPAPPAPPDIKFQTRDDLKYLRLSGVQAVARIGDLGRAAQREWARAVQLSKTPEERAARESARGWGMLFLIRLLEQTGYPPEKMPGAPTRADAAKAFTAATKGDPTKPEYWQGLGDSYVYRPYGDETHEAQIVAAYGKAIALGKPNPSLRFKLYQVQLKDHPKEAYENLKAASLADPDNGYVQDLLAEALFQQVHYGDVYNKYKEGQTAAERAQGLVAGDDDKSRAVAQDALAALERGIAANESYVPTYAPPVPKTLRRAWDYWNAWDPSADSPLATLDQGVRLRNLARNVTGFAAVAAREGDTNNAVRACQDCVTLGLKLTGEWPVQDSSAANGETIQVFVGVAIAGIGYRELKDTYTLANQPLLSQQAEQKAEVLKQQQKAYLDAVLHSQGSAADFWGRY